MNTGTEPPQHDELDDDPHGSGKSSRVVPMPLAVGELRRGLATQKLIPMRYQVRDDEGRRSLTSVEAPNIAVRIERGLSLSASAARKYPEHTIFLDGVANAEPFLDTARRQYNLDHHEGCVRSFTLATCEQAMVLVRRGLDLSGERWTVLANEPDLDTVLAIWVLLNHRRLADAGSEVRGRVMPLVRLQGVIDAHGFELADLTGFPVALQRSTRERIDELRTPELEVKRQGRWGEVDLLEHTAAVLLAIDQMVYTARDFEGLEEVEELDRVPIGADRFAVICRSALGIYELEQYLKKVHEERIGLIILERTEREYTIRQVDPFLPTPLEGLYDRLNLIDPAVLGANRWGGGSDIGGSPRNAGTRLEVRDIAAICRWVYRPPAAIRRLQRLGLALLVGGAVAGGAVAGAAWSGIGVLPELARLHQSAALLRFPVLFAALAVVALGLAVRRRAPRLLGLRRPRWDRWVWWAPVAVLAAASGGSVAPLWVGDGPPPPGPEALGFGLALVLVAVATELLFRGVVHGLLVEVYPVMVPGGRRYPSVPLAVSSLGSTLLALWLAPRGHDLLVAGPLPWAATLAAALVLSLACGVARERSGSVMAAAALHVVAVLAAWVGLAG